MERYVSYGFKTSSSPMQKWNHFILQDNEETLSQWRYGRLFGIFGVVEKANCKRLFLSIPCCCRAGKNLICSLIEHMELLIKLSLQLSNSCHLVKLAIIYRYVLRPPMWNHVGNHWSDTEFIFSPSWQSCMRLPKCPFLSGMFGKIKNIDDFHRSYYVTYFVSSNWQCC